MTQPPDPVQIVSRSFGKRRTDTAAFSTHDLARLALDALSQHGYRVVPADSTVLTAEEAKAALDALEFAWGMGGPIEGEEGEPYRSLRRKLSSQHTESDL